MKKRLLVFLLVLLTGLVSFAAADELVITRAPQTTFAPFAVETGELAVNIRDSAERDGAQVGRLERGERLTVVGENMSETGEIWYEVALPDGTIGYIRADLLMTAEEAEAERAAAPAAKENQLIGNRNSKKYHEPWCHTLPKESNRVYFDSAKEAEEQGYVHCKNCD